MDLVTSLHYFGENGMGQGHIFLVAEEEALCEHLVSGQGWGLRPIGIGIVLEEQQGGSCWAARQAVCCSLV